MMTAVMLAAAAPASAADYSRYSNDELARMRGSMQNATTEERNAYRTEWQQRVAAMRPEERSAFAGKQATGSPRCRPASMEKTLGLSESQQQKLQLIRKSNFMAISGDRRQLMTLRQEIRDESLKKNPDSKKIGLLSEQIGRTHAELARKESTHLHQIASVLTPGQIEKMKTFMQNRPGAKHGRMML